MISFVSDKRFGLTDTCLFGLWGIKLQADRRVASTATTPYIHGALCLIMVLALRILAGLPQVTEQVFVPWHFSAVTAYLLGC
jgi:hypothetical protein